MLKIEDFNKAFGTAYETEQEAPFPIPADAPAKLRQAWDKFVQSQYPLRLVEVKVTPEIAKNYRAFVVDRFKGNLEMGNEVLGTQYASWDDVKFTATMPIESGTLSNLWSEFVTTAKKDPDGKPLKDANGNDIPNISVDKKIPHSAEADYHQYLLTKYGSLEGIKKAYGWDLKTIEQAQMPYDIAYLVTFANNDTRMQLASMTENFAFVLDYLILRGRAVLNTVVLIVLTLLAALTVNPLAAYALSRFQMRQMPAIILFLLATMAFPHAVSMIPGYLLMRDLHLLNTYAALILPSIANGMSIFLLKGFFDSLPPELYEAAALDGAPEWQMFLQITLPLSKPILAVIALNAFMHAYNSWEWALVVCQNQKMWTLAVWVYQFNTLWQTEPWAIMASFILASLPVFLVFLFCQNIILRGIILPQMK